jgi:hypothetical protein
MSPMPTRNSIQAADAVVDPFATVQDSTFGEWLRLFSTSTSAFLEFQRASLQASLSVADALGQANRQMLQAWAGAAQQTDRALRETEREVSSSQAEPDRELARRDDVELHIGRAAEAKRTNGHRSGREQKPARRASGARRSGNRG